MTDTRRNDDSINFYVEKVVVGSIIVPTNAGLFVLYLLVFFPLVISYCGFLKIKFWNLVFCLLLLWLDTTFFRRWIVQSKPTNCLYVQHVTCRKIRKMQQEIDQGLDIIHWFVYNWWWISGGCNVTIWQLIGLMISSVSKLHSV